jgi:hypothetical protein
MDLPIACKLGPGELRGRTDQLAALAARALRLRERIAGGERLTFEPGERTERELRAVVAAEAECCPFLRMELRRRPDALVLDVTGPEDARPVIAGLFKPAPAG